MKQRQKSSRMVSTNSAVTVFACRTSPIQTVTSSTTNMARILIFPAPSSSTLLSLRLRPQGNCLPSLVMATVQLCARSLARVAGIGIFPSHVLRTGAKKFWALQKSRATILAAGGRRSLWSSSPTSERASQDGDTLPRASGKLLTETDESSMSHGLLAPCIFSSGG